jgi:GMC oxidoreductase/3-keto-disaccharide hydrolase
MGKNLIAHLQSNLTIRVPVTSLTSLPPSAQSSLQASALFVKGKANIAGEDRFFHLQITASGLNKLGQDSEAELFKKIPDTEQLDTMLRATDTHVIITLRGIGEMTSQNPDSFVRLSPTRTENSRSIAEVTLADVKTGTSNTPQSNIDKQTWDAMDALADEVALIFANGKAFEILSTKQGSVQVPAGATAADLKAKHPYPDRRDAEGSTHHDAGTLWMGADPAASVTNEFGRIHDTTNCYVAAPALFPSLGSPNPMLTGVALARRTADLLETSVLPRAIVKNASASGFTALFDGTVGAFKKWRLAGGANGFAFLNGELVSYGSGDFSMLYYASQAFDDFHLRLQFRVFDAGNCNSGVFIRFLDPLARMPDVLRQRADAEGAAVAANAAWTAVFSGFEVQIDDNARGDVTKDYYGRKPEPDGLAVRGETGCFHAAMESI